MLSYLYIATAVCSVHKPRSTQYAQTHMHKEHTTQFSRTDVACWMNLL